MDFNKDEKTLEGASLLGRHPRVEASSLGIFDFGLPLFLGWVGKSCDAGFCGTGLGFTLFGLGGLPTGLFTGGNGISKLEDKGMVVLLWSKGLSWPAL